MRRTQRENFLKENPIYLVIGITGILVIILFVLIFGKIFGEGDGKDNSNNIAKENQQSDIKNAKNALKKDTIPELTELMQQYYTAMSASDLTTLEQIVSTVTDEDKDIIRRKKDYIEGYTNVSVYSKLCPLDDSYLVFAGYDMKFKNEETTVPGMETFYVKKSEEGNFYIDRENDMEAEVRTFIDEQIKSKSVQTLFEDVNRKYVDALASSPTLLSFIEGFDGDQTLIAEAKKKAASLQAKAEATKAPEKTEPEQTTQEPQQTTSEPQPEPEPTPDSAVATDTNEEVLITANVNLRAGSDEAAERMTTMIVGDRATRVSITDNGWSKVQYNGMEGYVKSDYVTTFHITSDNVVTTTTINIRLEASETANMAGQVAAETVLMRYAVCDNGWSQVQYNGGVGYVKTEYLVN